MDFLVGREKTWLETSGVNRSPLGFSQRAEVMKEELSSLFSLLLPLPLGQGNGDGMPYVFSVSGTDCASVPYRPMNLFEPNQEKRI